MQKCSLNIFNIYIQKNQHHVSGQPNKKFNAKWFFLNN